MTSQILLQQLKEEGWNVNEQYSTDLIKKYCNEYTKIVKLLLETDIKQFGTSHVKNDLGTDEFPLPVVLQVCDAQNISVPRAGYHEFDSTSHILLLSLTDGVNQFKAIEMAPIEQLKAKTPTGTKIKLFSHVQLLGGFFLLDSTNTAVLGGRVPELYKKWEHVQEMHKLMRCGTRSGKCLAPPWVPFGKRISHCHKNEQSKEKFRSLDAAVGGAEGEEGESDSAVSRAFQTQRTEALTKAVNEEGSRKVFGGGMVMRDTNVVSVAREMQVSEQRAEWALKSTNDNKNLAMAMLKKIASGEMDDPTAERTYSSKAFARRRGRGRRGGRGRGRGGRSDEWSDDDDDGDYGYAQRSATPTTLGDFIDGALKKKLGDKSARSADVADKPARSTEEAGAVQPQSVAYQSAPRNDSKLLDDMANINLVDHFPRFPDVPRGGMRHYQQADQDQNPGESGSYSQMPPRSAFSNRSQRPYHNRSHERREFESRDSDIVQSRRDDNATRHSSHSAGPYGANQSSMPFASYESDQPYYKSNTDRARGGRGSERRAKSFYRTRNR